MGAIGEVFQDLIGLCAWKVENGWASFLTMEFGEPRLEIREPRPDIHDASARVKRNYVRRRVTIVGRWHFWLQHCTWVITTSGGSLSSADEDAETIKARLEELDGQILISVSESPDNLSCKFEFDLGGALQTAALIDSNADNDQWTLHHADGRVFAYGRDGTYQAS